MRRVKYRVLSIIAKTVVVSDAMPHTKAMKLQSEHQNRSVPIFSMVVPDAYNEAYRSIFSNKLDYIPYKED